MTHPHEAAAPPKLEYRRDYQLECRRDYLTDPQSLLRFAAELEAAGSAAMAAIARLVAQETAAARRPAHTP